MSVMADREVSASEDTYYVCKHFRRDEFWRLFYMPALPGLFIFGFMISIGVLVMIITFLIKSKYIRRSRLTVDINIAVAIVLFSSIFLVWHISGKTSLDIMRTNTVRNVMLYFSFEYSRLASFMWLFCKGFILYLVNEGIFSRAGYPLIFCIVMGWIIPALMTAGHATLIYFTYNESNDKFWTENDKTFLMISIPVTLLVVLSFGLYLRTIVIMLYQIFPRREICARDFLRRCVRGALTFISAPGIFYTVNMFRPLPGTIQAYNYEVVSNILNSCLGLWVAGVLWFNNEEMITDMVRTMVREYREKKANELRTAAAIPAIEAADIENDDRYEQVFTL